LLVTLLLCLPALTPDGTAVAQAAEANQAANAPLAMGSGYGRSEGSARVRALQQRLHALGQQPGPIDGLYGPLTQAAVKRFQGSAGLAIDGIAGPQTQRELNAEWPQLVSRGAGFGQRGGSDQVRMVQRHLRTADERPGPVDGLFGPRTEAAVIHFQAKSGLTADGVVGPETWRGLEGVRTRLASSQKVHNVSFGRAIRTLRHTAQGDFSVRLSKLPSSGAGWPDLNLLALMVLAAVAFVVAMLGYELARRRAPAVEGRAMALLGGEPAGTTMEPRAAMPASARPRGSNHQGKESDPVFLPEIKADPADTGDGPAVRAIGCISIDPRAPAGYAGRKQIAAIGQMCDRRGWDLIEIVHELTMPAAGANSYQPESALGRLMYEKPSCLIVAELRALGELPAELGRSLEVLRTWDVRLVAIDAGIDTGTSDGCLAAEALIAAGQLTEGGAARPAVHNLPPLKEHIVAMRSSGMTLQAIADRLNDEGVPTMRGGKEWRPSSVQVALGYRRPGQRTSGSLPHGPTRSRRERR
jgi:peptidoglycan hydrolase-like protein with peptidoglycan-binding domain